MNKDKAFSPVYFRFVYTEENISLFRNTWGNICLYDKPEVYGEAMGNL